MKPCWTGRDTISPNQSQFKYRRHGRVCCEFMYFLTTGRGKIQIRIADCWHKWVGLTADYIWLDNE